MAQSPFGAFADLRPYANGLGGAQVDPLQSLIEGFQTGQAVRNIPQVLQEQRQAALQDELARRLNVAIMQKKLNDLQNPEEALARRIQEELSVKGALNPQLGISSAPTGLEGLIIGNPNAIASTEAQLNAGAPVTSVAPGLPTTPIAIGESQTGINFNPNIPLREKDRELQLANQAKANEPYTLSRDQVRMVAGKEVARGIPKSVVAPKLEVSKEGNEMVVRNPTSQEVVRREPLSLNEQLIHTDHGTFRYTPGKNGEATLIEGTAPTVVKPEKPPKPLPKGISERISDAQSAIDNLVVLKSYIDNPDVISISGPVAGRTLGSNPFSETVGKFDGARNLAKQVIGKYLEGGVLRLEDEKKYETIIPSKKMLPAVQQSQAQVLYGSLRKKLENDLSSYEKSGYDVTDLKTKLDDLDSAFKKSGVPSTTEIPFGSEAEARQAGKVAGDIIILNGRRARLK